MSQPASEEIKRWNRWFAVELNNLAWTHAENLPGTAEEKEEMLNAAHASAYHWSKVGTEANKAGAELLLARVHTILGHGGMAIDYARRSFSYFTARESSDSEMAFAHAVLAGAALMAGEMQVYLEHYLQAKSLGETLSGVDEEIFQRSFAQLPEPED